MFKFAGLDELIKVFFAQVITVLSFFILNFLLIDLELFRSFYIIYFILSFIFISGLRISYRVFDRILCSYFFSNKIGKRVLIIGAGFGGLQTAKSLANKDVDVMLVDKRNHHLFQPLLYQVATAALTAILPEAKAIGLKHLDIATSPENPASIRVIEKSGGTLVRRYTADKSLGGHATLLFRVSLAN